MQRIWCKATLHKKTPTKQPSSVSVISAEKQKDKICFKGSHKLEKKDLSHLYSFLSYSLWQELVKGANSTVQTAKSSQQQVQCLPLLVTKRIHFYCSGEQQGLCHQPASAGSSAAGTWPEGKSEAPWFALCAMGKTGCKTEF